MSQSVRISTVKRLTESSIMIAIGTVLSLIKLIDMPYGGSVTIACMLPVVIIAYRYGVSWGLFTGFVFGLLQQL
ncbi:MAG: energy-coupled thiamine transporter ThiT, partial [Eubacterium sp.]|nr:energy-coupled thiamine transporter ThiT [Eubacterium sp.]